MKKFIILFFGLLFLAAPVQAGIFGGGGDETNCNGRDSCSETTNNYNTTNNEGGSAVIEEGAVKTFNTNIVNFKPEIEIENDIRNDVDVRNDVRAYGGDGGDASIEIGTGGILNNSKNFSPEANAEAEQSQRQGQEQFQGQNQSQANRQENVQIQGGQIQGQANKQTTEINIVNPPNHIRGPEIIQSRPTFTNNSSLQIKAQGWELVGKIDKITYDQAKKLGKDADDFEISEALLFENDVATSTIEILRDDQEAGAFMGYLYLIPDGDEVTAAGGIGVLAVRAMKIGATHMKIVVADDAAEYAEGSAWNVGIGGGASLANNGGKTMIAPNGGLGYGKAKAYNDTRPAAMVELYLDSGKVGEKVAGMVIR